MTKEKKKQIIEVRDPAISASSKFEPTAEMIAFGALIYAYYHTFASRTFVQGIADLMPKDGEWQRDAVTVATWSPAQAVMKWMIEEARKVQEGG
jgi:hypothetical protein